MKTLRDVNRTKKVADGSFENLGNCQKQVEYIWEVAQ